MRPLLQPQNKTHPMFICLHVHVLVLIHEIGHLHGGGRSFGLGGTGSIIGYDARPVGKDLRTILFQKA